MTFSGILPAVVTPLDEEESFVPSSFEALLERVYEAGADGVYVSGQTGEGLLQSVPEREKLIDAAVANSPAGKLVIAHIGASRTADAVRLARHASRAGVSAVSSLPPAGVGSFPEVKRYYQSVAAAAGCPLLVYYFPALSAPIASLEAQRELLAIENVVGLKFTDFDLYRLSRLKKAGACVFNGRDEILAAGLLMGADGGIGSFYNLVPGLFVQLYREARAGNWQAARAIQDRVNELIEIGLHFPLLPAIKTLLEWSGIPAGPCFAPRGRLARAQQAELADWIRRSSFAAAFPPPAGT